MIRKLQPGLLLVGGKQSERFAVVGNRIRVPVPGTQEHGEVVQVGRDVGMSLGQALAVDSQRLTVEGLSLFKLPAPAQGLGQVVHGHGHAGMDTPQLLDLVPEPFLEQRNGLGVTFQKGQRDCSQSLEFRKPPPVIDVVGLGQFYRPSEKLLGLGGLVRCEESAEMLKSLGL